MTRRATLFSLRVDAGEPYPVLRQFRAEGGWGAGAALPISSPPVSCSTMPNA